MKFIEQFRQLKILFDHHHEVIPIPGSGITIRNMEFQSQAFLPSGSSGYLEDSRIGENMRFRYPVLMTDGNKQIDRVIVYLHGLNERTWDKHLTGAKYLAEKTGRAVILFPLSYHINRGLPEWTDSRKMARLLDIRRQKYPLVREASIVNLALSERLTNCPERFYISGLQSALDLIQLLKEIQGGAHPLFQTGTKTDIFAYSISCMLLQSLMISNPDNILGHSRIVFFAGGSLFSHMNGISRFIMDSVAFESIRRFYYDLTKRKNSIGKSFQPWLAESKFGQAFKAIIAPETLKNVREKKMSFFRDQLMVIALRDDKVIPVDGIKEATGDNFFKPKRFNILHFPYPYTHENPFPVLYRKIDEQVERAFLSVFNPAYEFYTGY